MRVSAKADYAVRAMVELVGTDSGSPRKGDAVASAQGIPLKFLENILADLRHAGLVGSRRGQEGGYWLARPAKEISVADVIRAVEGPLASVRGEPPESTTYPGNAEPLQRVWIGLRTSIRRVVEVVSVADIASGKLPASVRKLADEPESWTTR